MQARSGCCSRSVNREGELVFSPIQRAGASGIRAAGADEPALLIRGPSRREKYRKKEREREDRYGALLHGFLCREITKVAPQLGTRARTFHRSIPYYATLRTVQCAPSSRARLIAGCSSLLALRLLSSAPVAPFGRIVARAPIYCPRTFCPEARAYPPGSIPAIYSRRLRAE